LLPEPTIPALAEEALPIIDRAELLERLGGNANLIPRFTTMFVASVEETMKLLQNAVEARNAEDIHRQSHTIKGAAANIGAHRIREHATRIDDMAKAGELSVIDQQLQMLESEFEQFKIEVQSA
jgi:HPt (histidine-containing phosphotransfer) domain-containing protein